MEQQKTVKVQNQDIYYVRQAKYVLLINIIIIQLLVIIAAVTLVLLVNYFSSLLKFPITSLMMVIVLFLFVFDIIFTVRTYLNWLTTYYVITTGKFVLKNGIFFKKEKYFKLNQIETISVQQGLIARLSNYGTLVIYSPLLENKARIFNIPEPFKYERILLVDPHQSNRRVNIVPTDHNPHNNQGFTG